MSKSKKFKLEIKHRWLGSILFTYESEKEPTLREAILEAIKQKANLSEADLSFANLSEANLSFANLSEANLSFANLSFADLSEADLSEANLSEANLRKADLRKADLSEANLSFADLSFANLSFANLSEADLSEANLRKADFSFANLRKIKEDFKKAIRILPKEIPFLRKTLIEGKINGSTYQGECACLAGTMAHATKQDWSDFKSTTNFPICSNSPREIWFLAIQKGDTPENNQIAKITLGWIDEVLNDLKGENVEV